ncbi:helix-turn-helix domain-containing protein [Kitasatospora sp. NPDC018619]|uniref:helix-turn-helix domain-containing protein n=1 Tax=unclassified Kitasatospora TaxID=2633591 RepID=UPI0037B7E9A9
MGVETEEFAAMLRGLKERSGRSYGALATRLHVSTSTLHRYCNGAAVPAEYAPVERLARACGADAGELVELHRRWILADAARRREAGAPAGAPAEAPPPEAPPVAAAPAEASCEASDESSDQASQEELVSALPPAPAAPRRSVRRRVLLSATAVAALAAVVYGFGLRDAGRTPHASAPSPTAPAATAPATAPAPAAPTAPAAAGSAPTDTPAAKAPETPETPEDLPAPFSVRVLGNNWGSPCDQWFLSPRSPAQMPPPPSSSGRIDGWASSQRLVPAGHLRIELTALGADSDAVVLNAMYVQVVSARPAPKWNAYTPGSGCGGGLEPAAFAVDLDAAAPHLVPAPGTQGRGRTDPTPFPYRISATDPQVIDVDAATRSQDVSWYLELEWTGKGLSGTMQVGSGDQQPFRTVGMHGAPNYFHNGTSWAPAHAED